jgi:hypothetical protein
MIGWNVRWAVAGVAAVAAALAPSTAGAQAPGRSPRAISGIFGGGPPPDPDRTRQEFSMSVNLLAGYDDNLVIGASSAPPTGAQQDAAGYLGDAQVDFEYFRGRTERSLTIRGGGHSIRYSEAEVGFQNDANLTLSAVTRVRRRDQWRVNGAVAYDDYATLGAFESLEPALGLDLPTATPDARLTQTSSIAGQVGTGYLWTPGRNDSLDLQYSFSARRYSSTALEAEPDVDTHRAAVAHSRAFGRRVSLRTGYEYSKADAQDRLGPLPVTEHTVTLGPVWQRQVSRTRRLEVALSAGAQYVETVTRDDARQDIAYWTPAGSASVRLDLGRSWAVWSDYSRNTSIVPLVATTALTTDAVSLSTGGRLSERFGLTFTTGWARGASDEATGAADNYTTVLAGTQLQWRLGRRIAAMAGHTYYQYRFDATSNLPVGFAPSGSRNAVRVGVTIWLPLIGRYLAEPGGGGR